MKKRPASRSAFSLVEVVIAIGVATFCLVAIFGLLPIGISSNQTSAEQTAATNILTAVSADLRSAPNPSPRGSAQTSLVFKIPIPAAGATASAVPTTIYISEDGQPAASAVAARYQMNLWMTPPVTGRGATIVRAHVSWPPTAPIATAAGFVETLIALDRN